MAKEYIVHAKVMVSGRHAFITGFLSSPLASKRDAEATKKSILNKIENKVTIILEDDIEGQEGVEIVIPSSLVSQSIFYISIMEREVGESALTFMD